MNIMSRRVRGFRLVDLVALGLLVVLVFGVYLAKTMAGRERAQIAQVERQIQAERARIRLLQAEVSHLEQPARIEHLSETYLGMGPVPIRREAEVGALPELARPAPEKVKLAPSPITMRKPIPVPEPVAVASLPVEAPR